MLKGSLYVTTDINSLHQFMINSKILILADIHENDMIVQQTNGVVGSLLLPPYPVMCNYVDGNLDDFFRGYMAHLSSYECDLFITSIVAALLRGINVTVYVSPDEYEMYFTSLSSYIMNVFGICIGNSMIAFNYNESYDSILLDKLYKYNLISVEEYFTLYPFNTGILDPYVVNKLAVELNPYMSIPNPGIEHYTAYFNEYKKSIKFNNNKFLKIVMQKAE